MKLLFWNLKNNHNEKWVEGIINENKVDVALFAEYENTSFDHVLTTLSGYMRYDGYGGCKKITLLCKNEIETIVRREQSRYTLYSCEFDESLYNIVGIHLPASPYSNSNDRKSVIRDIVQDISEQERNTKSRKTIVIGDFNCNPFDEEIVQKDSFNAVLFKQLINLKEVIRYNSKEWRRFYNPILHFISESTEMYGSFYYSAGSTSLYWHSFDQILVRKGLVENICFLDYIKKIEGKRLLKNVKPDETISDHLPLIVDISKG